MSCVCGPKPSDRRPCSFSNHGLGFATILRELAISRANLALSLVSFNFGVELGQIAVVTAAFLSLRALAKLPWESTMRRWVSVAAAAIGIVWLIQRAFLRTGCIRPR